MYSNWSCEDERRISGGYICEMLGSHRLGKEGSGHVSSMNLFRFVCSSNAVVIAVGGAEARNDFKTRAGDER